MAQPPNDEKFSQRLKRIIEEQGIIQAELALASDLKDSQINALKKGEDTTRITKTPVRKCIEGLIRLHKITTVDEIKPWIRSYYIERKSNNSPIKKLSRQEGEELVQLLNKVQEQVEAEREQAVKRPTYTTSGGIPVIGRDIVIDKILDRLEKEQFVVLTGTAGVGKSEVARQVRIEARKRGLFTSVENISLELKTTIEYVLKWINSALRRLTPHKRMLLVIENYEQSPGITEKLDQLLLIHENLKVLATSRVQIHGLDEPIEPLEKPLLIKDDRLKTLQDYDSVKLLLASANSNKRKKELVLEITDENAPKIAELCIGLDGLPLLLLMASSWVEELTLQGVYDKFKDGSIIKEHYETDIDRQQTIEKLILWSYQLLDPPARKLFIQLVIFEDGCSINTVRQFCTLDDVSQEEQEVSRLLRQLKKHHFITFENRWVAIAHNTLRIFAYQLLEPENEERIREHLIDYYSRLGMTYILSKIHYDAETKKDFRKFLHWFGSVDIDDETLELIKQHIPVLDGKDMQTYHNLIQQGEDALRYVTDILRWERNVNIEILIARLLGEDEDTLAQRIKDMESGQAKAFKDTTNMTDEEKLKYVITRLQIERSWEPPFSFAYFLLEYLSFTIQDDIHDWSEILL